MAVTSADLAEYLVNPPDNEEDLAKYTQRSEIEGENRWDS